jgi:DNA-binding transcriptional MerR regulator
MGYRIKTISALLGVPRNTLLAWERRYNIVEPVRQPNGYREYSEADLARLREVKRYLDRGHRISEAISLSAESRAEDESPEVEDCAVIREAILSSLLTLERESADQRIRAAAGMSFSRRLDGIFFPLLRSTGDLWERGELSVAQEHYISSFCRDHLTAMLLSLEHGPASGPVVVCASWPEEQHELALLGVAIKLALRGSRIIYLGARTPHADLLAFCRTHRPERVCLSVTIPAAAADLAAAGRSLAALGCEVVIGGQGLPAEGLPALDGVSWARSSQDL